MSNILKEAYKLQQRVETERLVLREAERTYEASKKEFSLLIEEIKRKGVNRENNFILESYFEKGRSEVNSTKFLKHFGQELFNKIAIIKLNAAEGLVGKEKLYKIKDLVYKKETLKHRIKKI
jgi:hypothetical protein